MKQFILTTIMAFGVMVSSAQFTAVTTLEIPEDGETFEFSSLTDNAGIAYNFNNIAIGVVQNGEDFDVFGRYYMKNIFAIVQAPIEDATDNLSYGVGYSFEVMKGLAVEPNYIIKDEEGEFNLGLSYKF
jgi:opacity protein-like surface antigen|tara:strand:+ start:293 stop:679 length:387 start_codon:yes stop_codon:yes gene_type:complete